MENFSSPYFTSLSLQVEFGFKNNAILLKSFFCLSYHTVGAVACANLDAIATLLRDSSPFEANKHNKDDSETRGRQARCIWLNGKEGLTEHQGVKPTFIKMV